MAAYTTRERIAREEGRRAEESGHGPLACPYPLWDPARAHWMATWEDSRAYRRRTPGMDHFL